MIGRKRAVLSKTKVQTKLILSLKMAVVGPVTPVFRMRVEYFNAFEEQLKNPMAALPFVTYNFF